MANFNANSVTAYAHGTNAPIGADTITTSLDQPSSVAFDASGNVWVSNSAGNTGVTALSSPWTNAPIGADTITTGACVSVRSGVYAVVHNVRAYAHMTRFAGVIDVNSKRMLG